MNTYTIGQRVKKLGSKSDYATGRVGTVVEVRVEGNLMLPDKVRVQWDTESDGSPMKPIKTQVNKKFLQII